MDSSCLYIDTIRSQEEIAKKILTTDTYPVEIKYVCGIDISYKNNVAYCSATIINKDSLNAIEDVNTTSLVNQPYVPGLFVLREYEPIINTLKLLKTQFQILLIDGHGRLHPRRCGLASYVGVMIDKPTIGIAKSLLCGFVREDQFVEFGGDILGFQIGNTHKKQTYISTGHKVSLGSAINIVKELTKTGQWIPEPLRIADINSKKLRRLCSM
ncbi:MAG: endonuclease V [Nitrososphaeraceae archaeon]